MNDRSPIELLNDSDDIDTNVSSNPSFDSILQAHLSRRSFLKGSFGLAATTFFGSSLVACGGGGGGSSDVKGLKLNFNAVSKSLADAVIVPEGYTAKVLFRLGDPISATVGEYKNDGTDTGASHALRAGDHHDSVHYFGLGVDGKYSATAADRGLLVMNHEAITPPYLHVTGPTIVGSGASAVRSMPDEVIKELNSHGVSVIEVNKSGGSYNYKKDSTFNRRVTTFTDMTLAGPAAKTPAMITAYSKDGSKTRGTVNNCAHGYTPWNTYLTCEENWAGYFRRITATDNPNRSAKELTSFARYGVSGNGRELWATATAADPTDTSFSRWNHHEIGRFHRRQR